MLLHLTPSHRQQSCPRHDERRRFESVVMLALMDSRASLSFGMHTPPRVLHESGLDQPAAVVSVSRSRNTASASMVDWGGVSEPAPFSLLPPGLLYTWCL